MFGILADSPVEVELSVSIFYGRLHAADLMFGLAALLLSLAMMRDKNWKVAGISGFAAATAYVIKSYPFVIGPVPSFICGGVTAAWLAFVGVNLFGFKNAG